MLHGCTQSHGEFVVGTGMNRLAEEQGFIVAYPGQTMTANQSGCWNWFNLTDQMRDVGEPRIIAGITRTLMAAFDVDGERVFVAAPSTGRATAAAMSGPYSAPYAPGGPTSRHASVAATGVG